MKRSFLHILAGLLCLTGMSWAHELRPAYLELTETEAEQFDVLWKVSLVGGQRMPLFVQLPEETENLSEPFGLARDGSFVE